MSDDLGYTGKRVIVSGAASGIGAATTRLLIQLGAEVHAVDATKPDISGLASYTECDLGDTAQIEAAAHRIGRVVHTLFHCSAVAAEDVAEAVIPLMSAGGAIVLVTAGDAPSDVAPYVAARTETLGEQAIEIRSVRIDATIGSPEEQARSVLYAGRRGE